MAERYRVPAVRSAVAVLRALERRGGAGAIQTELVRETGVSKSTMHNLLATLAEEGFVHRAERSREYRLGPALIHLGAAAARTSRVLSVTMDSVAPLAAEHGLSFAIAQPAGDESAQIVERFYPPEDVHVGVTIGSVFGPFDGALGKCLLAAMEPEDAERTVRAGPIPAHTKLTITSPKRLLAEVAEVRRLGWAASRQELNENNAVAAPVIGPSGEAEAFVVALGFTNQLPDADLPSVGGRLHDLVGAIAAGDAASADGSGPERANATRAPTAAGREEAA